jgi:hypothetical protein
MSWSLAEMTILGSGGSEAIIESDLADSLDDEDANVSTNSASSIEENATRPSSDSVGGCGRTAALRTGAEARDGTTLSFAYFPFGPANESALGLFTPALILTTLILGAAGIVVLFTMAAFACTLAFGVAPSIGTDFI